MIKVFLAEDEWLIREGIKNRIQWEENEFILTGQAEDGEKAYTMIQEIKPDILITDIIMPFMNGLELSERVLKILPGTKIIVVSGYDNPEYAKRAIDVGVTEYLLKPITSARLLKSLCEVRRMIEDGREKSGRDTEWKKESPKRTEKNWEFDAHGGSLCRKEVEEFLQKGSWKDIGFFIEKYIQSVGETNMGSLIFRQYVMLDMNLAVMGFLQRLGYNSEDIKKKFSEFDEMPLYTSTLESTKKYLAKCFEACMVLREGKQNGETDE